jgi:hypothetical protein
MALIADNAGIFVGPVLDAFNELERVVARDGDLAAAQEEMRKACIRVAHTKQTASSGTSSTTVKRT